MEELRQIGSYVLIEEHERQVHATTWRAAAVNNDEITDHVFIDHINPALTDDPSFLDRYMHRGKAYARMDHPHVLKKTTSYTQPDGVYSVYEYQEGYSLAALMERAEETAEPIPTHHSLFIVSKVLQALAYARESGVNHGHVNPAMALITDEGNVKLKGFTVGDAIRVHAQRDSVTAKEQANYRISGSQIKEDFDCADVFACGAILFQLLTGEIFKSQTGEPGNVIANATLAETGESFPLPIANILYASLDPGFSNAYSQVLSMNEALEKLLQDGPFTVVAFDLAFFMHQLFREEVDVLSSKQQAEKGKNIKTLRAEPTSEPVSFASQPVPPAMAEASVDRPREKPFKRKKPNPFLFFGAAAAVVAIMVGVYFGLQRRETDPDRFDQERARLLQKAAYLSSDGLRAQQEELERQASVLRKQLRQQARMENDRKKQELEDEMIQLSDEISRIGILAEQRRRLEERERKAEQERLRLEAEAQAAKEAAIAAREQQARQERERQRAQHQAEEAAAAAAAKEAEEPEPVVKTTPPVVAPVQELQPEQPATIARVGESGVTAPVFKKRFPPHYPRKAYRVKLEGYVLLDAVLNSDGTIDDIKVLRGLGKGKLGFEEEAIKAVKTWQYQPGQVNGAPSNVRMTLKVDFKLQ